MGRVVRWRLVGCCLLLGLAGCARMWFAEREPWRREAEVSCLRSGAVKEGPSVTIIKAIEGPGVCGADYPLRVAALGEPAVTGFAEEPMRPPATIPAGPDYSRSPQTSSPPMARPASAYLPAPPFPSGQDYAPPPTTPAGMPLSLAPPLRSELSDAYARQRAPIPPPIEPVPLGRSVGASITTRPATVSPPATLACPLVSALDRFVSGSVQPAAARWFGEPVVEIKQISAYSCRGMNGNSNARISEHAFGNALDIAAFTLADGRTITVKDGWHGTPQEQAFLRDIQGAACALFTTVLAPGSNVYHYDHMHVDLMRRSSGHVICQPAAISGEAAFARAGGRYGEARQAEITHTGAVATRSPNRTSRLRDQPVARDPSLPRAIAGED